MGSIEKSVIDYRQLPLWKQAYELGTRIYRVAGRRIEYETSLRLLREKAEALPATIATCVTNAAQPAAHEATLRQAYELAHDMEYLLLFSLLFRDLRYKAIKPLVQLIHRIKLRLLAEVKRPAGKGKERNETP